MLNLITNTDMTNEEVNIFVQNRVAELTSINKREVIPLIFEGDNNYCIGYFFAPTRMQIMSILGKGGLEPLFQGQRLLESNLIKEESDKRFLHEDQNYDEINIGAFLEAYASANKLSKNLAEKKTGK